MVSRRLKTLERSLIAWNIPNLITVPLMAGLGFLLLAVLYQVGSKAFGRQPAPDGSVGGPANNTGGY